MKKKVAIIGAGFTGLAAAWDLTRRGFSVTVFEADAKPGGLASGMRQRGWRWSLEYHYHHIFQTDKDIISLLQEMGLQKEVFFTDTPTRSYYKGRFWRFDSPQSLLAFAPLSFINRLRVGFVLFVLKCVPDGSFLERYTAASFLRTTMGVSAWQVLWKPLFVGKFGSKAEAINMAWFWARIRARSPKLGYFKGGFLALAEKMKQRLKKEGAIFYFNTPVHKVVRKKKGLQVLAQNNRQTYDAVISTLPAPLFSKTTSLKVPRLPGLGALTLVLELNKSFFPDGTYWLNLLDEQWPFLAVVEHTNLAGKRNYGNKHLVYVGKYLEANEPIFSAPPHAILKQYEAYLNLLSPGFKKHITRKWVFRAPFAQPLPFLNHSRLLPPSNTSVPGLFWASMQHVYPWDRGTNFAVRFGRIAAREITQFLQKI